MPSGLLGQGGYIAEVDFDHLLCAAAEGIRAWEVGRSIFALELDPPGGGIGDPAEPGLDVLSAPVASSGFWEFGRSAASRELGQVRLFLRGEVRGWAPRLRPCWRVP